MLQKPSMTQPYQTIPMPTKTLFSCTILQATLATTLTLALSACGGGGGDVASVPTPVAPAPPPPDQTLSLAQGRWLSTGLTPGYTAIMVPATTGANIPAVDTVWALAQDASTLIKLKVNGSAQTSGAVTGNVYTLGTTSVKPVSGGSYNLQTNSTGSASDASVRQMSLQSVLGTTVLFDRTDVMSTALRTDQANGRWAATLDAVVVNWTVQGNSISGASTSGCTYSGQSTVVATQSLYRVQFTETCSGATPTTQTFNGVATMSPDDARMTVAATNETETRATALLFARRP